jgi:hypothetical protein
MVAALVFCQIDRTPQIEYFDERTPLWRPERAVSALSEATQWRRTLLSTQARRRVSRDTRIEIEIALR